MRECSLLVQLFISTATQKKDVQRKMFLYVKKNFKLDEDVTYKHRSNYFICMNSIYYCNFTSKQSPRWIHAKNSG